MKSARWHLPRSLAIVLVLSIASSSQAINTGDDPFLGDWEGKGVVAQVIPLGADKYEVILLPEFDAASEPLTKVDARRDGNTLRFQQSGWKGVFQGDSCRLTRTADGGTRNATLSRVKRLSPTLGAKPPTGAIVLFNGNGFDKWQVRGADPDTPIAWKIEDDAMVVAPSGKQGQPKQSLVTRQAYRDFQLHFEFWLPLMADQRGQARANGGLVFEDYNWYEIQVLDSYGLDPKDNECGGIYKVSAPAVNMCRPPLMWQTYDIEFSAPRYDASGKRTRNGRISVKQNGKTIHHDIELPDSGAAAKRRRDRPDSATVGRILLHYHHDPVRYRNIWLVHCPD